VTGAGPRDQALEARYLSLGRAMADATEEALAGHIVATSASFDDEALMEGVPDEQRAKIEEALGPFSEPRERDFVRRALAASSEPH
jgi:hypothetical protein